MKKERAVLVPIYPTVGRLGDSFWIFILAKKFLLTKDRFGKCIIEK